MGTRYEVLKESNVQINLDEMSCFFQIDVSLINDQGYANNECTRSLSVDQVIDVAVNLLGPLHYFVDREEMILEELKKRLKARGFT